MNATNASATDRLKVRAEHHERVAFVYVRQSSLQQVRNNLESQRLQAGFAEQALSRLSRNDLDWHHLVYMCRWTGTPIADEQVRAPNGDCVANCFPFSVEM